MLTKISKTACMLLTAAFVGATTLTGGAQAAEPRFDVRFQAPRPAPVSNFGLIGHFHYGRGFEVLRTVPGSTARRIGLEPGDVILSVEGREIRNEQQFYNIIENTRGEVHMRVRNVRTHGVLSVSFRNRPTWCQQDNYDHPWDRRDDFRNDRGNNGWGNQRDGRQW